MPGFARVILEILRKKILNFEIKILIFLAYVTPKEFPIKFSHLCQAVWPAKADIQGVQKNMGIQ